MYYVKSHQVPDRASSVDMAVILYCYAELLCDRGGLNNTKLGREVSTLHSRTINIQGIEFKEKIAEM